MLLIYRWGRTANFELSMGGTWLKNPKDIAPHTADRPMSNPASVSELSSSYRPSIAARKPTRFGLVRNLESAMVLG
jgi:hypothetical protein